MFLTFILLHVLPTVGSSSSSRSKQNEQYDILCLLIVLFMFEESSSSPCYGLDGTFDILGFLIIILPTKGLSTTPLAKTILDCRYSGSPYYHSYGREIELLSLVRTILNFFDILAILIIIPGWDLVSSLLSILVSLQSTIELLSLVRTNWFSCYSHYYP